MKNLLAHTFNIAACVAGGTLLAATPFVALASMIAGPGSPTILAPIATLGGGAILTTLGYTRAFGGQQQPQQPPPAPQIQP